MTRKLVWIPVLIAGVIVGRRLLPVPWRESLSRLPGGMIGWMIEHMPDQ